MRSEICPKSHIAGRNPAPISLFTVERDMISILAVAMIRTRVSTFYNLFQIEDKFGLV